MLDNVVNLLLTVSLLKAVFGFSTIFALTHMVPGTAIGVLVGDLLFFWMTLELMRRTGRDDITAMPLGLDTPSTFGMVFFVLGPAFLHGKNALGLAAGEPTFAAETYAWHIGIWSIVWSGLFKLACSFGSGWVRSIVPRAGLLGSLTAVALVLISFLPLLEVFHYPLVGLTALAITLTTLTARIPLPGRIPGTVGAVLVAGLMYWLMHWQGWIGEEKSALSLQEAAQGLLPTGWLEAFRFEWIAAWRDSLDYLPIVIPFALATVVGGIDCTESAAAAGDEFDTNRVIGVEALATIVAGLCGGVIQTTPYIGHPAYKAMGARAAFVLATALFIGSAGLVGYFAYIYVFLPKIVVLPILIFIGLEITAQSFLATPRKHYTAVAFACVPALAALGIILLDGVQGEYKGNVAALQAQIAALQQEAAKRPDDAALQARVKAVAEQSKNLEELAGNFSPDPKTHLFGESKDTLSGRNMQTLRILNNGFIVTSLLWASILASLIDRRLWMAAAWCGVAALCSVTGIIHSPLPGAPLINPFHPPEHLPHWAEFQTPYLIAAGYAFVAALFGIWQFIGVEPAGKDFHDSQDDPDMPLGSAR